MKYYKINTYDANNKPYTIFVSVDGDKQDALAKAFRNKLYKNEDDNIDVESVVEISKEEYKGEIK